MNYNPKHHNHRLSVSTSSGTKINYTRKANNFSTTHGLHIRTSSRDYYLIVRSRKKR